MTIVSIVHNGTRNARVEVRDLPRQQKEKQLWSPQNNLRENTLNRKQYNNLKELGN